MTDDHSSAEAVALKACPFCGGAGIAREWENWLRCQDCEADGPYKNTQAEAVAAWNTRATPSDQDKLVGELVEALSAIIRHYGKRKDAPTHDHQITGIWGDDNGPDKAGKPCEWCAQWTAAVELLTRARVITDQEKPAENYLVWSNEHSAWWGRDRCGYTRVITNAGRYSRSEALGIAGTRDGGWHVRKGNPDEIAIPERDAIEQYADITRAQEVEALTRARQSGSAEQ